MTTSYHLQHRFLVFILISSTLALSSCSTLHYYTQSIQGQLSILYNREDIDQLLKSQQTNTFLKTKLQQVKTIRQFASQSLQLPDNKSYLYYTDLHRPYVVWNVFAAPEFSLKPYTWCYPIVGCVSYRGYFKENDAHSLAQQLSDQGNDVYVTGIAAYSTLGWFDDPLLSSMIRWRERALAGLIFHELSHQVVYISNETAFNEAFASAVERIGSLQWLIENHQAEDVQRYLGYLNAQNDFRNLLNKTRIKLSVLYESNVSAEDKRNRKAAIITEMKSDYAVLKQTWPSGIHFDLWFKTTVNNARFTSSMTYLQKIPAFYALFLEENGDWLRFFKRIKRMEKVDQKTRNRLINQRLNNNFDLNKIVELLNKRQANKSVHKF